MELLEDDVVTWSRLCIGVMPPGGRAVGNELDEAEALALELILEGLLDGGLRLLGVRHVGGCDAGDIGRGVKLIEQLAHVHGRAVLFFIPAVGRGGSLRTEQRGSGHLAAGHAVNCRC